MLTAVATIKTFMDDDSTSILEYNGNFYQKMNYSKCIKILYRSIEKPTLSEINLELIGFYNSITKGFICISNNYHTRKLFLEDEIKDYSFDYLQNELNNLVGKELTSILELQTTSNTIIEEDVREQAKQHFLQKTSPIFSLDKFFTKLTLENLESFISDKIDFAYICAENIINNSKEIIEEFQNYQDVKFALTQLKDKTPIQLELNLEIQKLSKSNYKTFNLILTKDGIEEIEIRGVKIKEILNYPYYAIKKVYWGRKLLFSLDDYDKKEVSDMRKDVNYHIEALKKCSPYNRSKFLTYVDIDMFSNFDFCNVIINYNIDSYHLIDISYKENICFIKNNLDKIGITNILENVSENFILQNESFFLDIIQNEDESYFYESFPKSIQEKENFMLKLISKNGLYALDIIPSSLINNKNIQKAFDDYFSSNIVHVNDRHYNMTIDLNKLKKEETILNVMTISNMNSLDKNKLEDVTFMSKFLDKIEASNLVDYRYKTSFYSFYSNLNNLKNDMSFMKRVFSLLPLSDLEYNNLEDNLKNDLSIQKIIVNNNNSLIYLMNKKVQLEFILQDAEKYVSILAKEMRTIRTSSYNVDKEIDEDFWIKIVEHSDKKPSNLLCLKHLSYKQKQNENLAKKLIKINPKSFEYFDSDIRNNSNIAKLVLNQNLSVIPLLPKKTKYNNEKSLFDNKEIMKESLAISPLDFSDIPTESRTTGLAPLLEDKDFILYVMKLEPYNIRYLSMKSLFREDFDVARETLILDMTQATEFAGKIFRDESFVYSLLSDILKTYQDSGYYDEKIKRVNQYIMHLIPKKIKNSKDFITEFPMFYDEEIEF